MATGNLGKNSVPSSFRYDPIVVDGEENDGMIVSLGNCCRPIKATLNGQYSHRLSLATVATTIAFDGPWAV